MKYKVSKHFKKCPVDGMRGMTVEVRGSNVEGAIRLLTRRVKQEGLMREIRQRSFYEKPSVVRRRKAAESQARWRKLNNQNKEK
jgi:small subunit ribosomal protein S21